MQRNAHTSHKGMRLFLILVLIILTLCGLVWYYASQVATSKELPVEFGEDEERIAVRKLKIPRAASTTRMSRLLDSKSPSPPPTPPPTPTPPTPPPTLAAFSSSCYSRTCDQGCCSGFSCDGTSNTCYESCDNSNLCTQCNCPDGFTCVSPVNPTANWNQLLASRCYPCAGRPCKTMGCCSGYTCNANGECEPNTGKQTITCPPTAPYLIGLYGNSGWWMNRIGAICASWTNINQAVYGPILGTSSGGGYYAFQCPSDMAVTQVNGYCNPYLGLQIVCAPFSGATSPTSSLTTPGVSSPCSYNFACGSNQFVSSLNTDWDSDPYFVEGTSTLGHITSVTCIPHIGRSLNCPDWAPLIVGIYGNSGWWLNRVGLYCTAADELIATVAGPIIGSSHGGSPYSLRCPYGYLVSEILGYCNNPVLGLQIVCTPIFGSGSAVTLSTSSSLNTPCFYQYSCLGGKIGTSISLDWDSDPYFADGSGSLSHIVGMNCVDPPPATSSPFSTSPTAMPTLKSPSSSPTTSKPSKSPTTKPSSSPTLSSPVSLSCPGDAPLLTGISVNLTSTFIEQLGIYCSGLGNTEWSIASPKIGTNSVSPQAEEFEITCTLGSYLSNLVGFVTTSNKIGITVICLPTILGGDDYYVSAEDPLIVSTTNETVATYFYNLSCNFGMSGGLYTDWVIPDLPYLDGNDDGTLSHIKGLHCFTSQPTHSPTFFVPGPNIPDLFQLNPPGPSSPSISLDTTAMYASTLCSRISLNVSILLQKSAFKIGFNFSSIFPLWFRPTTPDSEEEEYDYYQEKTYTLLYSSNLTSDSWDVAFFMNENNTATSAAFAFSNNDTARISPCLPEEVASFTGCAIFCYQPYDVCLEDVNCSTSNDVAAAPQTNSLTLSPDVSGAENVNQDFDKVGLASGISIGVAAVLVVAVVGAVFSQRRKNLLSMTMKQENDKFTESVDKKTGEFSFAAKAVPAAMPESKNMVSTAASRTIEVSNPIFPDGSEADQESH